MFWFFMAVMYNIPHISVFMFFMFSVIFMGWWKWMISSNHLFFLCNSKNSPQIFSFLRIKKGVETPVTHLHPVDITSVVFSFQRRSCERFIWNRSCIHFPLNPQKDCSWLFPLLYPLFFQDGASPIFVASQNGHINVVKYLISKGAQVNQCRLVRDKF